MSFCPTPRYINKTELEADFDEFARKMRCKWYFKDSVTEEFSETPAFRTKSKWQPPGAATDPRLEVFLSRVREEILKTEADGFNYPNLSKEERQALKDLKEDSSIIIKPADKGSVTVVWDKNDYLQEAYGQLQDKKTYQKSNFGSDKLENLVKTSNGKFHSLFQRKLIDKKAYEYLKYPTLGETNLGKMYLLPKIHKRLSNVPGRAVISNCGAPTEKVSEFLDSQLKPMMQAGKSYIRDSLDFINKIKQLDPIPENAILVKMC